MSNSKFRTSMTSKEGHDATRIVQGRIVNINLVKWTVDVVAQFDRYRYFNIQIGSPYLHHSNGEGFSAFPEVGATCMVCIPSDSSPPFVISFVMAHQTINDTTADAPLGTSSRGAPPANPTDSSFAGGRPQANPGDMWMRTRDNNFIILRRGGVLQIGSTELAQRIYIPLNNLITDISENYEHHNAAGSINWGIQDGPSLTKYPGQFLQTFRVYATDKYADIKVAIGKVFSPVPEPDGNTTLDAAGVGVGDDGQGSNPIICEVTVSPQGFVAENGEVASASTVPNSVFRFVFDRTGNALLRTEGNLYFKVKKKLTVVAQDTISFQTSTNFSATASSGLDLDGGTYAHVKGDVVRLGQGELPVARMGDLVRMSLLNVPVLLTFAAAPTGGVAAATLTTVSPFYGSVARGNNKVLA